MIFELEKDDYEKVQSIYKPLEFNLITRAVIEGSSPGRIYVDDIICPKTAFMCTVEGYYLAGNENNDVFNTALNKLIVERIFAGDTVRKGEKDISLCISPNTWELKLDIVFKGRSPFKVVRRHYICTRKIFAWENRVPDGFSVHPIDERFLKRRDLEIHDHIIDWMMSNWVTTDHFLQNGFGFCTLHGRKTISWCIADCISGRACEVGIRTISGYRRRGLGTLTVAATVDYCLSHGFTVIGWHCDEDNLGSVRVAEKAGFERERDYIFYICMFDDVDVIQ
ncbi:MAG: GNAT family N-acetyltransferase [Candidatus Hodarchaeota archaeon]